jgi:hypothetical protein
MLEMGEFDQIAGGIVEHDPARVGIFLDCFCQAKSRPFDDRKWSQWASVDHNLMIENRAS